MGSGGTEARLAPAEPGDGAGASTRYDAFISYAHADDSTGIVDLIQQTLRQIAKPWNRRSALRVFRDETALSASPELWSSITEAIDGSAWFVLIASPAAASSEWVDREVARWLDAHGGDRLLTVLVDGTWIWDDRRGDFDETCNAVPPSLRGALRSEPRHIDLTWAREGELPSTRDPRWRDDIAELAAPIHGLSKEDLSGADLREHRRTRRLARAAVGALVVLALAAMSAAVIAVGQAREARQSADRAEAARADAEFRALVAGARDLRSSNRDLALLLAVEARHLRETPESDGAIQAAIVEDHRLLSTVVVREATSFFSGLCAAEGTGRAVAAGSDGTFAVVEVSTGRTVGDVVRPPGASEDDVLGCDVSAGGRGLLYSTSGLVWPLEADPVALGDPIDVGGTVNQGAISPDGTRIAVGTTDGRLVLWDATAPEQRMTIEETDEQSAVGVAFSPDSRRLATGGRSAIRLRDATTTEVISEIPSASGDQAGGLVDLPEPFRQLEYDVTGTRLVDNRRAIVRAYDPATGEERWATPNPFATTAPFTFTPDGRSLLMGDGIGDIVRVSSDTGEPSAAPMHPTEESYPAFVDAAADTVVLGSFDSPSLATWALDGRSAISTTIDASGRTVISASPDSSAIAVIVADAGPIGEGEVFDVDSGDSLGRIGDVAFPTLLDRNVVAGFFLDQLAVSRWDLEAGGYRDPTYSVELEGLSNAEASSAGEVAIVYDDGTVRRYGPDGDEIGDPLVTVEGPLIFDVAMSRDGDRLAVNTLDNATQLLDGRDGHEILRLEDAFVGSLSERDRQMAVFRFGGVLELRSSDTGELLRSLNVDPSYAYSQNDVPSYLLASAGQETQLYDRETLREVGEPFPSAGTSLALPDGSRLVTTTDEQIVIWELDPDRWEAAACAMAGRNLTAAERREYLPEDASGEPTCPQWPDGD